MRITVLSIIIGFLSHSIGYSQCNIKTINRPDGITVKYINPEQVGSGTNCELGLSVSSNGEAYFINSTVRYFSQAKKQSGSLKIQLQNNDAVDLTLYNTELASVSGNNVSIGVYLTTDKDINSLKSGPIQKVIFTESDGMNVIINVKMNNYVIINQLACLKSTSDNSYSDFYKGLPIKTIFINEKSIGKILEYLSGFNNQYSFKVGLFENSIISSRILKMAGNEYDESFWDVMPPIEVNDNMLFVEGMRAHSGGSQSIALMIDLNRNVMYLGIKNNNQVKFISEDGSNIPQKLLNWQNKK